jgi:hypothetical protein
VTGYLIPLYFICVALLSGLTRLEVIPKLAEDGSELLWAFILVPIFFFIFIFIYYFERDEM